MGQASGKRSRAGDTGSMRRNGERPTRHGGAGLVVAALTMCLLLLSAVVGSPAQAVSGDWRHRMLDKVNYVRALAGVPPVRLCQALQMTAQAYARQMAATQVFSHQGTDGSQPSDRMARAGYRGSVTAENIGAGQETVVQVMRAWRASPSHYAAMTDPRLRHVGFGYAPATGTYDSFWVQDYGVGGDC